MEPTPEELESVRAAMLDIMATLYEHGIRSVHLGALMRLLGADEAKAQRYDDSRLILDEQFAEPIFAATVADAPVPDGTTFH